MEFKDKIPFKTEIYPLYTESGWNERLRLNPDELDKAIHNSFAVVSVYEAGELIGFGRVVSDGVAYATIYDVMVMPRWQGQGIGSNLLEKCLSIAEKQGFESVHGIVLHENRNMLALGKKLGFEIKRDPDSGDNKLVIHLGGNRP